MHFKRGNCNIVIDKNFSSSLKTQNVPHLSVTSGDTVSRLFSFKMSNRPKINRECICSRRHCSDTEIENVYLVWVYLTSRSIVMIVRRTVKMMMMMIRAQWDRCWGPKSPKIETGHLFSIVKLNFNVGLFSCIFWFEAIFLCKSAIFCRSLFTREKGPK